MPRHLQVNDDEELGSLRLAVGTADDAGLAVTSESVVIADATDGNVTITLPTAVGQRGRVIAFKRIDGSVNTVTIAPDGSETIDGAADAALADQWDALQMFSDGANWLTF